MFFFASAYVSVSEVGESSVCVCVYLCVIKYLCPCLCVGRGCGYVEGGGGVEKGWGRVACVCVYLCVIEYLCPCLCLGRACGYVEGGRG